MYACLISKAWFWASSPKEGRNIIWYVVIINRNDWYTCNHLMRGKQLPGFQIKHPRTSMVSTTSAIWNCAFGLLFRWLFSPWLYPRTIFEKISRQLAVCQRRATYRGWLANRGLFNPPHSTNPSSTKNSRRQIINISQYSGYYRLSKFLGP